MRRTVRDIGDILDLILNYTLNLYSNLSFMRPEKILFDNVKQIIFVGFEKFI